MRLLKSTVHPDINDLSAPTFIRKAARAIVMKEDNILLVYTQRYQDYSLPGGGIDELEDNISGLKRELAEETGAQNPHNITEFGRFEEFRPCYKGEHEIVHMISYCYRCQIDEQLLAPQLEDYEIKNGMSAHWVNLHKAIDHNLNTMANSDKKGLSILRETYLLQLISKELNMEPHSKPSRHLA